MSSIDSEMGIVFDSMVELYNEGKPVDFVTLPEKLKEKDVPPEISSMEFAKDLLTAVPTSVNVGHYAKIVKEKAMLRRLIKMNEDIANTCYLDKEPVEEIMEDTEKQSVSASSDQNGWRLCSDSPGGVKRPGDHRESFTDEG